jgi:hypothetical protein
MKNDTLILRNAKYLLVVPHTKNLRYLVRTNYYLFLPSSMKEHESERDIYEYIYIYMLSSFASTHLELLALQYSLISKLKVKLSLQQAVKAHRFVRRRDCHIILDNWLTDGESL